MMTVLLDQEAVIVCTTEVEYTVMLNDVVGRYGPGGINEGLIVYTAYGWVPNKQSWRISLKRVINNYSLE